MVLVGTLYPMFADLILKEKISVGPPFFNTATLPLAAPLIGAMAFGPMLPWKRARLFPAMQRLWWAALRRPRRRSWLCLALEGYRIGPALGFAAALWVIAGGAGRCRRPRSRCSAGRRRPGRAPAACRAPPGAGRWRMAGSA